MLSASDVTHGAVRLLKLILTDVMAFLFLKHDIPQSSRELLVVFTGSERGLQVVFMETE